MIREIINFTNKIDKKVLEDNLILREGLHLLINLQDNSNNVEITKIVHYSNGVQELTDEEKNILKKCSKYGQYTKDLDSHKYLDQGKGGKKIHSCSPFCVAFKKQNINVFSSRLETYFNTAIEVCCFNLETEKILAEKFKIFCVNNLFKIINHNENILELVNKLSKDDYIIIYFNNASIEQYWNTYHNYLTKYLYLKNEYNYPQNRFDYGLSSYLNRLNTKKIFLEHKTSLFNINNRISKNDALVLYKFSQLQSNRVLPNPLPIFIEEDELNNKIVSIYCEDKKISYSEIIKKIFETRTQDLHNYYLFNFQGGEVKDFDYVSTFRYKLNDFKVEQIFQTNFHSDYIVNNIFDFEKKIISKIFNNGLIVISKEKVQFRYFEEMNFNSKITMPMYNLIQKYRKSIYNYIYKSEIQAISGLMLKDIMMTGIIDDLKNDELKNGYHKNENSLKEKLNIYFSVNHHFDKENKNFNQNIKGVFMPSRIKELEERIRVIADNSEEHFNNEEEFAYGTGQIIYYLLYQSESSNKTHALLEPFLQKTEIIMLQESIVRVIGQYKHNIVFNAKRFNKLTSEVLGFSTDINLKLLTPFILAGYFANCIIFESTKQTKNNKEKRNE